MNLLSSYAQLGQANLLKESTPLKQQACHIKGKISSSQVIQTTFSNVYQITYVFVLASRKGIRAIQPCLEPLISQIP